MVKNGKTTKIICFGGFGVMSNMVDLARKGRPLPSSVACPSHPLIRGVGDGFYCRRTGWNGAIDLVGVDAVSFTLGA